MMEWALFLTNHEASCAAAGQRRRHRRRSPHMAQAVRANPKSPSLFNSSFCDLRAGTTFALDSRVLLDVIPISVGLEQEGMSAGWESGSQRSSRIRRYDVHLAPKPVDYILWQPSCDFAATYDTGPYRGSGIRKFSLESGCRPEFYDVAADLERCGPLDLGATDVVALPVSCRRRPGHWEGGPTTSL